MPAATLLLRYNESYLVNCTRNQTLYVFPLAKDLWEGCAESWCSLHRREADLPNVVGVLETKDTPDLVGCDTLLNAKDLAIKVWHGARCVCGEKI